MLAMCKASLLPAVLGPYTLFPASALLRWHNFQDLSLRPPPPSPSAGHLGLPRPCIPLVSVSMTQETLRGVSANGENTAGSHCYLSDQLKKERKTNTCRQAGCSQRHQISQQGEEIAQRAEVRLCLWEPQCLSFHHNHDRNSSSKKTAFPPYSEGFGILPTSGGTWPCTRARSSPSHSPSPLVLPGASRKL